jgi:hypothetical protein
MHTSALQPWAAGAEPHQVLQLEPTRNALIPSSEATGSDTTSSYRSFLEVRVQLVLDCLPLSN